MYKTYRILVVLLILALLSGCEKKATNYNVEPEIKNKLSVAEIYKSLNEIEIKSLINLAKEKEEDILSEEFSWIKECEWETVDIIKKGNPTKTITDTFIINDFINQIEFYSEVYTIRHYYETVPLYTYIFKSSDKELSIEMISESRAKINNRYFDINWYSYKLGDAFIPVDNWRVAGNIETKFANCGLIKYLNKKYPENPQIVWDDWRIYMTAQNLSFARKLISPPSINVQNIKDKFLIFYFGEEIIMNVFDHHVQIVNGQGKEYWYEFMEEEAFKYISVPLLGAN